MRLKSNLFWRLIYGLLQSHSHQFGHRPFVSDLKLIENFFNWIETFGSLWLFLVFYVCIPERQVDLFINHWKHLKRQTFYLLINCKLHFLHLSINAKDLLHVFLCDISCEVLHAQNGLLWTWGLWPSTPTFTVFGRRAWRWRWTRSKGGRVERKRTVKETSMRASSTLALNHGSPVFPVDPSLEESLRWPTKQCCQEPRKSF